MDDNFVVCPFNKSHIISKLRIQYHLVKCKKQYPYMKKLVCPYDATEYIDPFNYTAHLSQCKRHKHLDVSEEYKQKQYESIPHGDCSVQTFFTPEVEVTGEWDVKSSEEEDCDKILTQDEIKALKLKEQRTRALKQVYKFSPVIPNSVGRGVGSDLYESYIKKLHQTPENAGSTQSVSYFHAINRKPSTVNDVEDEEGIYDDAEDDDILIDSKYKLQYQTTVYCEGNENSEQMEVCRKYDDEEQVNSKTNKRKFSEETVACSNDNQKSSDLLNDYKSLLGRGSNKHDTSVDRHVSLGRGAPSGRGTALRRGTPSGRTTTVGRGPYFNSIQSQATCSNIRSLDCILSDVIQNKLSDNIPQLSKYNKEQSTQPVNFGETASGFDASKFSDWEDETLSVLSSHPVIDNSCKTDKSSSSELDDSMICFSKGSQKVNTTNKLDSLLNSIVSDLSLTSLQDRDPSQSTSSVQNHDSLKEGGSTVHMSDTPIVSSFGRGFN